MIDVWLLFGLVLPFLDFLLSIFEELVAQLEEDVNVGKMKVELKFLLSISRIIKKVNGSLTRVAPKSPFPSTERQERLERTGGLLRLLGRKILPMATIAFVLIYWTVASVAYFTPTLHFWP